MKKVLVAVALAVVAAGSIPGSASASNAVIVIPFEKHFVGTVEECNRYVGSADGGTIEMLICDSWFTGDVQHFTATVLLDLGEDRSLTAILDGRFDFNTLKVVLNGSVVDGWLEGARVHEESQLVGFAPLTFEGIVKLMPGSAG